MYEEAIQHYNELKKIAYSRCDSKEEAEDVLHDTYKRAFEYWDNYEEGTNCKAWMCTILRGTHINKKRKHQPSIRGDFRVFDNGFFASSQDLDVFEGFSDDLIEALKDLPKKFRGVVLLRGLHNFRYKEIAYIMECPLGTVMSRLHRARNILQSQDGGI